MRFGLAHQLRIGVGQAGPAGRGWSTGGVVGRLGRPAARARSWPRRLPSWLHIAGVRPRPGLGFRFQPGAGSVELRLERLAPGDLGRQRLRVDVLGIGRLGLGGQRGDVGRELRPQRPRPIVPQRADLRGIGIDLGPVDRHRAQPQQPHLARQQQNLQKRRFKRRLVGPPKAGDRVVVGVRVGGDETGADVPVRRPLDPPRGEDAVGMAVDEQRQHQPRMVLRLAAGPGVGVKRRQPHPLHRRHDKMRDIVRRQPILHIRRQQKRLLAIKRHIGRHRYIRWSPQPYPLYHDQTRRQSDRLLERFSTKLHRAHPLPPLERPPWRAAVRGAPRSWGRACISTSICTPAPSMGAGRGGGDACRVHRPGRKPLWTGPRAGRGVATPAPSPFLSPGRRGRGDSRWAAAVSRRAARSGSRRPSA